MKLSRRSSLSLLTIVILFSCYRIVLGSLAPDFTLIDIDGNKFSLSNFRGKVVILDFFATYCSPCKDEMSHLKAIKNEFGSKLEIISISVWSEDTDEKLRQFRNDYGITWILAGDTTHLYEKYKQVTGNPWGIPALYLIDQNGYIRYDHVGFTDGSILQEEIGEIIPASKTDLNNDEIVNIVDVAIVAMAFGTKLGDEHWNETADMDDNKEINIVDISIVALDYGKTV